MTHFHLIRSKKVYVKSESEKAVGIDFIPNEVLKNATVATVLTKYFNLVFSTGCLPTSWLRSIVKPIPKGAGKYLYIPMNYRRISLISCVGKLYSAVLNDRLVEYLGLLNLIADKQNGFRKDRSCEDHVFVLDYGVKNRLNNGQSTYVAFVDMAKAFDWVNRDFLLYKLLLSGVDGHFYKSVKAMYTSTESCVKLNIMCTESVPERFEFGDKHW